MQRSQRVLMVAAVLMALAGGTGGTWVMADEPAVAKPPAAAPATQGEKGEKGDKGEKGEKGDKSEKPEEDARLKALRAELERVKLEYELLQAKSQMSMAQSELKEKELSMQAKLRNAEQERELAQLRSTVERARAELEIKKAELEKLRNDRELREARDKDSLRELIARVEQMQVQNALLEQEALMGRHKLETLRNAGLAQTVELQSQLEAFKKKMEVAEKAFVDVKYPADPLIDGVLHISDRRIELDGPIFGGTAAYVTDRIHFFNNQSAAPIFIVINSSPGGSVMEGYRIVKAIQASKAPVHVVVKSFAASMAAVITTLAPKSYAYPNAIILHHQMSTGQSGNLTQLREQLENAKEWERRLAVPVAQKMGVSLEQFTKMMYEKNSDGDWQEFADKAKTYKWVDNVVDEIREEGYVEKPKTGRFSRGWWADMEQIDEKTGRRWVQLPRLDPFDFYAIYNPDGYFRK